MSTVNESEAFNDWTRFQNDGREDCEVKRRETAFPILKRK